MEWSGCAAKISLKLSPNRFLIISESVTVNDREQLVIPKGFSSICAERRPLQILGFYNACRLLSISSQFHAPFKLLKLTI